MRLAHDSNTARDQALSACPAPPQYLRLLSTRTREADPTRQALLGQLLRVVQVAGKPDTLAGQQMAQGLAGGSDMLLSWAAWPATVHADWP
jgi:hypothetical protein